MARTIAELPKGTRLTDYLSLGVLTTRLPLRQVKAVLAAQGKASRRQRELPAHVVVYYVIALALFMQVSYREVLRCLLEGLAWLLGPEQAVKVTGKSGISQARTRLGWEVLRQLYDEVVKPLAVEATRGAWYRSWRLVSLDGSTLAVADEQANRQAFGRPGNQRGAGAYPQIRFVALVENGTHVLFGAQLGGYGTGEITLAEAVVGRLQPGMLCLADRDFFSYGLWNRARARGADLLWRLKKDLRLPVEQALPDGSYLSRIYPPAGARPAADAEVRVRVIEYRLEGVEGAEPVLSLADHDPGPGRGSGRGIGGALPRTLGDRGGLGRTEDPSAGSANRPAQQDPGPGAAGILRAAVGAFRRARVDARSRPASRRRSRPALFPARGAGDSPQAAPLRRYSPLGRGKRSMRRCCKKSSPSGWCPAGA